MTANEIRKYALEDIGAGGFNTVDVARFYIAREQCAQLAELNEQLEAFRTALQPLILKMQKGIFG